MAYIIESTQQPIALGPEIGAGGEGAVFEVAGEAGLVAKIYHATHRTPQRHAKLSAMIANPPIDATRQFDPPHVSIAWPTAVLADADSGNFTGFLMPRIARSPDIYKIYNPQLRAKSYSAFDWRYLHRTAINLAAAIQAIHKKHYVLGDVNQKNILVTERALVTLVDTDSFQVKDTEGRTYRCEVGMPEYTPPELQTVALGSVDRDATHDNFGLGVLIFQLLMEGHHPFGGRPLDAAFAPDGNVQMECIRNGIFPYLENKVVAPPPSAPAFSALHPEVQYRFLKCFVQGHKNPLERPTAPEWIAALNLAEQAHIQCDRVPQHFYSNHLTECPWCNRVKQRELAVIQAQADTKKFLAEQKKAEPPAPVKKPRAYSVKSALAVAVIPAAANFFLWGGVGYFFIAQYAKGVLTLGGFGIAYAAQWKYKLVIVILTALDALALTYKRMRGKTLGEFDFGLNIVVAIIVAAIVVQLIDRSIL